MKVLFITHYPEFYGANRSLLQLIIELRENFEVEPIVIIPKDGEFANRLRINSINILEYKYYNWLNSDRSPVKSLVKKVLNRFLFRHIKTQLYKNNFDLIHTNSSVTNLGGYLSKELFIPHVWHIREYGYIDYNLRFYDGIKNATKFIFENSSEIVVISNDLKTYYSKYINPNSIQVIYNGVKEIQSVKKTRMSNTLNLCFIGLLSESKNQIEAIKACEFLIKERATQNLTLYIIGNGDSNYVNFLKEYVLKSSLGNNVKFIGYLENVNEFMQNMDVGIICSKKEAFGRVTIEYMMNKMPVIGSNTGANPELITNGAEGFLYEYGNFIDLAEKINVFHKNKDLLQTMGESAHKNAIKHFTSLGNAKNIFSIYNKILTKLC